MSDSADSVFTRHATLLRSTGLFVGCLVAFHLNGSVISQVDCAVAPYAAFSLAKGRGFDVSMYPEMRGLIGGAVRRLKDGRCVNHFAPGSTLAVLPLIAPIAIFRDEPPKQKTMERLGKWAASLYSAGAVVLFHLLCLRFAPSAAVAATLLFALGTNVLSVAAQAIWPHGPALFGVTAALWLLTCERIQGAARAASGLVFVAGLLLGCAVLSRQSVALFGGAAGVALLLEGRFKHATALALGALGPLLGLVAYNATWGNFLGAAGYNSADHYSTPLWLGLSGLLVAPSRGLLVYSPALLAVLWGIGRLFDGSIEPHARRQLMAAGAAALGSLILYAKWYEWWGGWCYGPRFLIETLPIVCLLFAFAFQRLTSRTARTALWTGVGVSIFIHVAGVLGNRNDAGNWQVRHDPNTHPRRRDVFFEPTDTQIGAHIARMLRLDADE